MNNCKFVNYYYSQSS